ncbi:3-(methylthio)propionyl-CoA ligase [Glaciimonas sp. Gout2]|uniref:3-(methylthio)propionyl-CoA ligase n=2 Tax=Glaciimonas TaxID=1229970 RepID=UPI002AB4CDE2|nr:MULTISPECIES: 3-(methylthio)propionyl-CoA ligase [unclassified Glaciimonas]MDY7544648.1 3-(methylthio)propionyl-CoA ligase [Glaciimonas sp. CA11.2]MEB0012054.1 3-(methylthio)propionyl-CoA ligase [Glaciimonas sp. Cout2]MEB0084285.1 3-(methylthio)propionyl-CoA ligase [Glaciimonas sp. Gout2]
MNGLMMSGKLLISSLIVHADRHHGDTEIVSRRVEGDIHRYTYRDCHRRARQLANVLTELGVKDGERVATLAWNGYRHLELYYAISGMGAVMHTINPRLHPEQVAYIANHAEDQYLFFDLTFLPTIKLMAAHCNTTKAFIAMTDRAHMPQDTGIDNLLCYEDLMDAASDDYSWPTFDEETASALCYTSGTTGNPKGVLYSHRSTLLHTYAAALPDTLNCSARDVILPVVPMFHVNAWGLPYVACMVGAKLVFPGAGMDGKSIHELLETEQVTLAAGVPTIWQGLLNYMETNDLKFSTMTRTVIGGSACPPAMLRKFQEVFGVHVLHAWGMTELSPLGTVCAFKSKLLKNSPEERYAVQAKQGRAVFGVDMKIVDEDGHELPWDGKSSGKLMVRGPWVVSHYYRSENEAELEMDADGHGWFPTGDIANIDADGYLQITDRDKDVIKSGGEWIGSIDLENIAMAHPAVFMAACIAVKHPKWDERPLLVVVKKPDTDLDRDALLTFYEGKIAKWWTPDDVVFVDALPMGATGKILKKKLREEFADYVLPTI